jgi:hypothetical protein
MTYFHLLYFFYIMVSIPEITAPSAYSYLLELINNTFYNHKRRVSQRWDYEDFDMDSDSAFFPRQPLSPLSSTYAIWEAALREAPENLRLGSDVSDEALSLRFRGAQWRENIRQVICFAVARDEPSDRFAVASLADRGIDRGRSAATSTYRARLLGPLVCAFITTYTGRRIGAHTWTFGDSLGRSIKDVANSSRSHLCRYDSLELGAPVER